MLDFNTEPYYDDFDENKKFHKILFRPGYPVQARELTQIQSIIQNQIKKNGDHFFKNGSMIIPGQVSIDTNIAYVKLNAITNNVYVDTYIENLVGRDVSDGSITALVVAVSKSTLTEPPTLFVKYKTSSTSDYTTKSFSDGETLTPIDADIAAYSVGIASSSATGIGSIASVEKGVYYINGYYVVLDAQTIPLEKYNATPSARIGLQVNEIIVTSADDVSLNDNATGYSNYTAPGADRYSIDLVLTKLPFDSESDENFIELAKVDAGKIIRIKNKTEYSELEKTLARRTYDESGNYTVNNFKLDIREYRNNDRGQWVSGRVYLKGDVVLNASNYYVAVNSGTASTVAPTHTSGIVGDSSYVKWEFTTNPSVNRGLYTPEQLSVTSIAGNNQMEAKLAVGIEPGKAYVQGYEIEKVATDYIEVSKARSTAQINNGTIPTSLGNYVLVNNLFGLPPSGFQGLAGETTFAVVDLYDSPTLSAGRGTPVGTKIGTCEIRGIEWHDVKTPATSSVYKLFIRNITMINGKEFDKDVKSFYYLRASGIEFTADVTSIYENIIGSGSVSSTTLTGVGTSFQTDLRVNDWILFSNGDVRKVTAIASQTSATLNASSTASGSTIKVIRTKIQEPDKRELIFQVSGNALESFTTDGPNGTRVNTIQYYTMRYYSPTSNASGVISLNTGDGAIFASTDEYDNYIVVHGTTGESVDLSGLTFSNAGTSSTITISGLANNTQYYVMATVKVVGSRQRTKTLLDNTASPDTFTTQAAATISRITLSKPDVIRIISIKMDTGTFASPTGNYTIDITDRFELDDGQTMFSYDLSSLVLKPSYSAPSAPIQVIYQYFQHGDGDYFTISSYPSDMRKDIPSFNGTSLADYIDFRPTKVNQTEYNGTSYTIKRGQDISASYSFYLARKDKLAIDISGKFFAVTGAPAISPAEPRDPELSLILYKTTYAPYTFSTTASDVSVQFIDNRRYTMRDIGKLEKRIENLEYYTSLSLLEQDTKSLIITDSQGFERFKNGFIVDNFTSHDVGDASSPDYNCSIDPDSSVLRPTFTTKSISIVESKNNDSDRKGSGYKLYGDVITLPVVADVELVSQRYASRVDSVNPFAIFTFVGSSALTPSSDDWFEENRLPDIVTNVVGNYETMKAIAEKSNILGTVWNSWQTTWSGQPQTISSRTERMVGTLSWFDDTTSWSPIRDVRTEVFATSSNQTRTGLRTSLVERIDKEIVNDRVISTSIIPYMRSRQVLVQAKGLKPNTRFWPYLDGVNIGGWASPASILTYSLTSAVDFTDTINAGKDVDSAARRIDFNHEALWGDTTGKTCLSVGDVITSGAYTAVVIGTEYSSETGIRKLHVTNIKKSGLPTDDVFPTGNIIGSITGATGVITASSANAYAPGPLVSNEVGDLNFLFWIPSGQQVVRETQVVYTHPLFRTGAKEFKLIDSDSYTGTSTSRSVATFASNGVLQTKQASVNAVRNAEIVQQQVSDNRTITQTSERVVSDTGWYDPLAQTFLVDSPGGAFLSKVDIFFASKDSKLPVSLEIREVVNGYPGKRILPFSKTTLKPSQVNISSSRVELADGSTEYSYDTPTTFTFRSPVYVEHNQEYALVLVSDSNNYKVWVSQLGDTIPGTTRTISEQPYAGVLFKSQNGSTWTADQSRDMKFVIYRCKFDTNTVANVEFINTTLPSVQLETNPFQTTSGVNKIRVWQKAHGLYPNAKVSVSSDTIGRGEISVNSNATNVTGVNTQFLTELGSGTAAAGIALYTRDNRYIGTIATVASNTALTLAGSGAAITVTGTAYKFAKPVNGIPAVEVFKTHTVSSVEVDSFVVDTTTNATSSGYNGGNAVSSTYNVMYDIAQPNIAIQEFAQTSVRSSITTSNGTSIDSTFVPTTILTNTNDVIINDNNYFNAPQMVASLDNSSVSTVRLNVLMSSTNDAVSPVIDTHRTSMMLTSNLVNYPEEASFNVANLDYNTILSSNTTIQFISTGIKCASANTSTINLLKTIDIGKYVTISGATNAANNGTFLVTNMFTSSSDGSFNVTMQNTFTAESAGASVTIVQREFFVDEVAPTGSSTLNKYVSKIVRLQLPSGIKSDDTMLLKLKFAANIPGDADVQVYYKIDPIGEETIFDQIPWTVMNLESGSSMVKTSLEDKQFYDINYLADGLRVFDGFQVKIVMKSKNSSAVPQIRDLRIIACS